MISVLERCNSPHWGVAGGKPGSRNYGLLESSIHGPIEITKTPDMPMAAGDLISIRTGGGGGYGNPFEREPERVLEDVLEGLVSVEAAEREYGVVIGGDSTMIDEAATKARREAAAI
jgi:N-methylhydantoinase B